jgi:hypothetical protein
MAVESNISAKKPDTSVQVPAAVKAAADRANELAQQVADAKKNRPPEEPMQVAQPELPPNPGVTMANYDPGNPQPPVEPQDWQHQFNSMKGRYDRSEQDNKRLAGQINDMQRLIATMNTPQPQQPGSDVRFPAPKNFQNVKRITDKEKSDYGDDLIDVMGRRAMEVQDATLAPELFALRNEMNQIKQQLGGVRQTVEYDAQTRMYQQLDREIPNWKEINSHPEFVRWLQMPDPLSGQIRHNMLGDAYNSQQANRVLEFFRRFLSDQASYGPANGQGQQPGNGALTAHSYATTPQVDLLSLAAPGRAKTGQTQVTPEKPSVSPAEIKRFYTDAASGKYVGREDEYNRIQQEIFAASRENRVR